MRTRSETLQEGADTDASTFRPFRGLGNPHVQTIASRIRRARLRPDYTRHRLDTDDGDFLDVDVRRIDEPQATCVLFHGLEGCAASGYMIGTAEALASNSILPVAVNFRSCSGEPNRTLGSYHSGRTDDIQRVLRWVEDGWPGIPRLAVGFSLGGNALLVHLGRSGRDSGLTAAAAVSVPFSLAACADGLGRGLNRIYGRYFMNRLGAKAREKAERFPGEVALAALEATTVRAFDESFTAPVNGFASADDYYERCSARRFLARIETPTLLLQAEDDPLVPSTCIPFEKIAANPALEFHLTRRGGHVGFYEQGDAAGRPGWMERAIASFLAARARPRGTIDSPG